MFKVLLVLAAFAALALSQEHHRCVAPSYFGSRVYSYDHLTNYYRNGDFFYDAFSERIRIIEKTAENQTRPAEDILVLHRERKQYNVDMHTGKCSVSVPSHEFRKIEVTEDYHFAENLVIGSVPGDGVEVSVWYRYENSTDVQGASIVEFTRRDCIPFYESFEGMMGKEKIHFRRTFFDVVTQVFDPDIFDIPKECMGK